MQIYIPTLFRCLLSLALSLSLSLSPWPRPPHEFWSFRNSSLVGLACVRGLGFRLKTVMSEKKLFQFMVPQSLVVAHTLNLILFRSIPKP